MLSYLQFAVLSSQSTNNPFDLCKGGVILAEFLVTLIQETQVVLKVSLELLQPLALHQ